MEKNNTKFDLKKFVKMGKQSRETVIKFSRRLMNKVNK
jgi:hypothetical protein